ncbi:MAG: hypothetical protein IT536_21230 [Hyphomicrobiales bacterium]|nr:hypothetical protein [Hyphomicrobiales bacterium]
MTTRIIIGAFGLIVPALLIGAASALAQTPAPDWSRVVRPPAPPAQRAQQQRRPARVIVRPLPRNRHDSTEFPRVDSLGYPGPNAVRHCRSWLATEYRVSGTVVTPQMRCWWQRG